MSMLTLTEEAMAIAVAELAARDADLAAIIARYGTPPLWDRPPGFATMLLIILEQQVSLASARAAFNKIAQMVDPVTPEAFLTLDDDALRAAGLSRQKAKYARALARDLVEGAFDLDALADLPDDEAFRRLVALHGIGPWSANIYLLMALRRPDVLPLGDLGLVVAMQEIKRLPARPTADEFTAIAEAWRPWRAVACRLLWVDYLGKRTPAAPKAAG